MALAPNSFLSSFLPSLSLGQAIHLRQPQGHRCLSHEPPLATMAPGPDWPRFESMSFVVNILACKLKIVNNRN